MLYSNKIDDPSFDKYIRNSQKWKFQFSLIIAAMVIIGFFLYGAFNDEMDNPEALQIGLGIGLMFVVIGFFSGLSKQMRSWDGMVVNKKTKIVMKDIGYQGSKAGCMVYTVYIKSETGKVHKIRSENDATLFNYYQIGDKVRRHERLKSYEKLDKSSDTIIFCNACAFMHSIEENTCRNCGCPLLK